MNIRPSVIVIGPDRVGKTTIVRHLSEKLGIPAFKAPSEKRIFKEGGRSSLSFDYTLTHFLAQTGHRFISDRGYPCEWVYSHVFGRESDHPLIELIDDGHAHIGTKILYLYSSKIPDEEDDIVPKSKYAAIVRRYDEFCNWTACRAVRFDTLDMLRVFAEGGDSSEATAERIIELMDMKKELK